MAITVDGYRAFIDASDLKRSLESLAEADLPAADRIEAETDRVDAMFDTAPIEPALEGEIRTAVKELLEEGPIAVRSSATAEDLGSSSFAGQYRTILDVEDEEAALRASRLCWASLGGPAVGA